MFVADHAEQVAGLKAGAAGGVEQFLAAKQRGDACAFGHVQDFQRRADAPLFCAQAIDE
ncbi:hypothetical protein D3C72_2033340 [compost metagenome]